MNGALALLLLAQAALGSEKLERASARVGAALEADRVQGQVAVLEARGSPVRGILAALEEADAALPAMGESDQSALVARVAALAEDGRQDDVGRAAAYRRLGRWTGALKSRADKTTALRALFEVLRAPPRSPLTRFRGDALESLAAAAWPMDRDLEDEARAALFTVALDRSLPPRDRRCLEKLNARLRAR